tara:strand:- start:353 stop:1582 length:1230 start_codon:yes stop_codon:yes gene_type:complete
LFEFLKILIKKNPYLFKTISLIFYFNWRIRKILKYRILDRETLKRRTNDFSYCEYSKKSSTSYYEPISVDGVLSDQIKYFINKTFDLPPSFYNVFENVNLIGPEAVGVLEKGDILVETAGGSINILDKCSPKLFTNPQNLDVEKEYDCASVFITPWINKSNKNYFHWFAECLLLIEALDHYRNNSGITPIVIINDNPKRYQLESLKLLGYDLNNISKWKYKKVKVRSLVVPSLRRQRFNWVDIYYPNALFWLRDKLKRSTHITGNSYSSNIFISREKSEGRQIINYDEFNSCLKKYNFESYCLEDIKFSDQITMFSSAKNIIAAHGAGLINIIFSSNVNIIEIFGSPPVHYTEYYRVAQNLGHNYSILFCDYSFDNYKINQSSYYKEHDLIINISDLEILIKKLNMDCS